MNRVRIIAALVAMGSLACSSSTSGGGGASGDGGPPSSGGQCAESFTEVVPSQKLAPDAAIFRQIVVDGSTLYLRTDDQILSVPASGGALTALFGQLGSDATKADAMWVDAQTIWFQSGNTFQSIPKSGGSPTMIGKDPTQAQPIVSSAHDADGFYYIRRAFSATGESYTIGMVAAQGGAQKDVAQIGDKPAKQLFVDGGNLYWFQGGAGQTALYRMPKSGGTPQKIADGDPGFSSVGSASSHALAIDDTYLYYSSLPDNALQSHLMRIAKDGSGQPQRVGDFGGDALTAQGGSIWGIGVISLGSGTANAAVWRATVGGSTVALACITDQRTLHAIAVDGASAYVAITNGDVNESGIYKVAR